jgi:hypothetical protein
MRYTVFCIIVCSRTKIRMISSLRNFSVCILDADRFTIVVFQILDIKSNYLPGIVQYERLMNPFEYIGLPLGLLEWVTHNPPRKPTKKLGHSPAQVVINVLLM